MDFDALDNSHPIEVPVNNPNKVDEIFDSISYFKGSCIIRLLDNWIGEGAFQTGLRAYLKKYSYKNTLTKDLRESLRVASGKPVVKVLPSWTKQMGFPELNVELYMVF